MTVARVMFAAAGGLDDKEADAVDREIERTPRRRNRAGPGIEAAAAKRRVDGRLERRLELRAPSFRARVADALVPGGRRIGDVGRHAVEVVGTRPQATQGDVLRARHIVL